MAYRKICWSFFVGNFLLCWKFSWSWQNFLCCKLFYLWKMSLIMDKFSFSEKFLDYGKLPFCGKFPCLLKTYLIKEKSLFAKNVLDQGKIFVCEKRLWSRKNLYLHKKSFLTAEKIISLIILKTNASVETIKTYFLSLKQKLNSLAFFAVDKINIIFTWGLKLLKVENCLICDSNKSLLMLNQIYSQKL